MPITINGVAHPLDSDPKDPTGTTAGSGDLGALAATAGAAALTAAGVALAEAKAYAHDLAENAGKVQTVNGVEPDAEGNVVVSGMDAGIIVGGPAPDDGWWIDTGSEGGSVPETIPGKVSGLVATVSGGLVGLAWDTPADGGSAINDFVVQYAPTGTSTWTTFSDGVNINTAATITGLTSGTTYDFRVAAKNAIGTGAWSDLATATPFVDPNIYVVDDFNRPDAEVPGTASTGQVWAWGDAIGKIGRIRSNQLEVVDGKNIINAGHADVFVEATMSTASTTTTTSAKPAVLARSTSAPTSNFYAVDAGAGPNPGKLRITRTIADVVTVLHTVPDITPALGDRIGIKVVEGSGQTTLTAYLNGVAVGTPVTDTTAERPSGNYVGLRGGNGLRFDNFSATNSTA